MKNWQKENKNQTPEETIPPQAQGEEENSDSERIPKMTHSLIKLKTEKK